MNEGDCFEDDRENLRAAVEAMEKWGWSPIEVLKEVIRYL
jgi:hypothetical protein